jgi:hypothetical protein
MTTSHLLCCAETVNSAISLWTELEVMDDDDEDLYTYQTLDTASAAAAAAQQQQLYQDRQRSTQQQSAMRGCLRASTIFPSSNHVEDHEPMMTVLDPKVQWQEEAYWMSFQNAVRSFSDHQEARASSSSSYPTCGAVPSAATRRIGASGAERMANHRHVEDDDDTDMSSFRYFHPHVVSTNDNDNDNDNEADDDDIPPCIPRTVVTPTASLGSHSMKVAGTRHSHSGGMPDRGGSMSIATSSSNSSASASASTRALPTFAARARSSHAIELQQPQPPATTSTSSQPFSPVRPGDGQFREIRRSLRELMAQAARNKKLQQQQAFPSSPMSTTTAHTTANGDAPMGLRRGDPGYIISSSLAGPTLEEIKGLRWRMKELAEHAAVVAQGHKDAEKYVIGGFVVPSSANNSSTL